jgi:hypothetical protein
LRTVGSFTCIRTSMSAMHGEVSEISRRASSVRGAHQRDLQAFRYRIRQALSVERVVVRDDYSNRSTPML